jgi:molecular chaperone GrpE
MAAQQRPEPGRDERAAARDRPAGGSPATARHEGDAAVDTGLDTPAIPEQQETDSHAAVVAELEDRWRRALADLDNLRKRSARELERERAAERARVAATWLPVVDNLELALQHASADRDALVEGIRAVRNQAVDVLAMLGFPRHEEVGMPFDPFRHEVVSVVDDAEGEPGTVVRVVRPGYGEGENQLRPTAVVVAQGRE